MDGYRGKKASALWWLEKVTWASFLLGSASDFSGDTGWISRLASQCSMFFINELKRHFLWKIQELTITIINFQPLQLWKP